MAFPWIRGLTKQETKETSKTCSSYSNSAVFLLIWERFKKHRLAVISVGILAFLITLSFLASVLENALGVSHDVASTHGILAGFHWPHVLGTNDVGQDVLTRLLHGGRISLFVGLISALASAIIGSSIGLLAGYYGGALDSFLMRLTDAMLSIPILPLMIVFAALDLNLVVLSLRWEVLFFGSVVVFSVILLFRFVSGSKDNFWRFAIWDAGLVLLSLILLLFLLRILSSSLEEESSLISVLKLILIIVFFGWMTVARLSRASALHIKEMEFVIAAKALGASHARIILTHVLPNAMAPIIVAATLEVGTNILYEAALSFLGLGIQPPMSSWGNMLNNAVDYVKVAPLLAFYPGFLILLTVACFNFLGDGIRDALDPKQLLGKRK